LVAVRNRHLADRDWAQGVSMLMRNRADTIIGQQTTGYDWRRYRHFGTR
jgi:hypothetical protein